ncbi:universal stress protein [Kutzneria buriramensis]|uniref:Nucleotide-binding universal stress UspA family protein n=1 Tax=Kutzneria buriramensis TaxID=1045776 RepID=A0A3E0GX44_9PSEU|nr:universal stress protein [Kutzneria buriramensis]REH32972.1 nucleotide-binding universal stress UspA family protein [Kutzneria buriramensis]
MDGVRRVVVGVDGSVGSLQALRRAVTEARMRAVPLVAVVAWSAPGGEVAYRRTLDVKLKKMWEQGAWERLARAWDEALGGIPHDVDVQQVAVRADAGKALVRIAEDENDLLVIGAGRRSPLRRALIPSVPRYCAAHALCSVLLVPPSPLSRQMDHGMLPRLLRRRRAVNHLVGG